MADFFNLFVKIAENPYVFLQKVPKNAIGMPFAYLQSEN